MTSASADANKKKDDSGHPTITLRTQPSHAPSSSLNFSRRQQNYYALFNMNWKTCSVEAVGGIIKLSRRAGVSPQPKS